MVSGAVLVGQMASGGGRGGDAAGKPVRQNSQTGV